MTERESDELFLKYRETRDIGVRNKLVENYMFIAEMLAKKFSGRGVDYDDLLQIAYEALIRGVENFDPALGNKFTTYITPTITGIIKNYFRDSSRPVRLPRKIYTVYTQVKEAINSYYTENGTNPTVKQLVALTGYSEETILEALESRQVLSLDARADGDDGESDAPLYATIAAPSDFEKFEDVESLKAEIAKLNETEQTIVKLRFFQGKSQTEVAEILGSSQMFVSRAERKIVEKLKDALL